MPGNHAFTFRRLLARSGGAGITTLDAAVVNLVINPNALSPTSSIAFRLSLTAHPLNSLASGSPGGAALARCRKLCRFLLGGLPGLRVDTLTCSPSLETHMSVASVGLCFHQSRACAFQKVNHLAACSRSGHLRSWFISAVLYASPFSGGMIAATMCFRRDCCAAIAFARARGDAAGSRSPIRV